MEEIFKDIEGYEGLYQASNMGSIKSLPRNTANGRILKEGRTKYDYRQVCLCKNGKIRRLLLSRLIAKTFIPNPDNKPQINHKNGIKADNRVENLEWCTGSENQKHSFKIGLNKGPYGEKQGRSRLNLKQVRVIRHCLKIGMMCKDIAKYFPVSEGNISAIKNNKSWKHITI